MSDTDEHEFVIEEPPSNGSKKASAQSATRTKPKMVCPVQPSPSNEERVQQQKMAEAKLLSDAGICATDMNDEERQNCLSALRLSLPEVLSSSSSGLNSIAVSEETQPMDDGDARPPVDVTAEDQQEPDVEMYFPPSKPDAASSSLRKASGDTGQTLTQPPAEGATGKVVATRRAQRKRTKESDDEIESGLCGSSDSDQPFRPRRTQRSSARRVETSSDSDLPGESQNKPLTKSHVVVPEASSDSDHYRKPLQQRVTKKLTDEQKQKAYENLHKIYDKTLQMSPNKKNTLPAMKEIREKEVLKSPQDLFVAEEGANMSPPTAVKTSTRGEDQEEETGGLDMEVEEEETQPPDNAGHSSDSQEGKENAEDEDSFLSQEFSIQATQCRVIPIMMEDAVEKSEPAPSAAAPRVLEKVAVEVTREDVEVELSDEEKEDKRPLPHDGRFCWSRTLFPQPLERKYRKRKRSSEPSKTYFRPAKVDPAVFSKHIVQLFNEYFTCYTQMQSSLKHHLPWGKPVHAGYHHPGTLDQKHRNEQPHVAYEADDDDDFASAPAAKKPAVGEGVLRRTGHDHGLRANQRRTAAHGSKAYESTSVPWSLSASQAMEDTQPYDLDEDELPDLLLDPGTSSSVIKHSDVNPEIGLENTIEAAAKRSSSPHVDSSQSSNSRLDENGDMYPTQFPSNNRARGDGGKASSQVFEEVVEEEEMFVDQASSQIKQGPSERSHNRLSTRKTARNISHSTHSQPVSRKRKQAGESSEVNLLDISDDEISFPQKKKREVAATVSHQEQIKKYIRVAVSADSSRRSSTPAVNQPSTSGLSGTAGTTHATVHPFLAASSSLLERDPCQESQSKYFPGYQSKGEMTAEESVVGRGEVCRNVGIGESVDDEDSVQFVSLTEPSRGQEQEKFQGATYSRAHTAKQKVQVAVEVEPRTECPLCGRKFPQSRIEQHASDCQGAEEEEEPVPRRAGGGTNPCKQLPKVKLCDFPRGQASRRPLHDSQTLREVHRCPYCDVLLGGQGALERHQAACRERQREQQLRLEHDIVSGSGSRSQAGDMRTAVRQSVGQGGWIHNYRIPRKSDTSSRPGLKDEDDVNIEEIPSDDSDKDPDFTLAKDDIQQLKDDVREDGDSSARFKKSSNMSDSDDVKGQSTGKRTRRQTKQKEQT